MNDMNFEALCHFQTRYSNFANKLIFFPQSNPLHYKVSKSVSVNKEKSLKYRTSFKVTAFIAKISINAEKHVKSAKKVKGKYV